jgi:hypothetical protein
MASLTAMQMLAFEAPELSGASITKNGVTFTLTQFFQGLLDTNNQSTELALAQLFRMLSLEDRNSSLTLGEFSFSRRTGMTYDERRQYWEMKHRATLFGQTDVAPTIGIGGIPSYPLVR